VSVVGCRLLGVVVDSWLCPVVVSCMVLAVGCRRSTKDCRLSSVAIGGSCLVLVVGCRLSSADCVIAVGGCCWFLVVGSGVGCRVLTVRLSGVAVGGCCWFLVVGCRLSGVGFRVLTVDCGV
jgi:hypothetical protein